MDEWEPKKGETVEFKVRRFTEVDPSVPLTGKGTIVRNITRSRAEPCDYEVWVEGFGYLCFYRSELKRCRFQ